MSYWNELGQSFTGAIGSIFTGAGGLAQGIGGNATATSQYNQAIAQGIAKEQQARTEAAKQDRMLIMVILLIAFILPTLGIIIFLIFSKK